MGRSNETRLDGLLHLLETGTSSGVRRMAAEQLGDLAAAGAGAAASVDASDAVDQSTRELLRRVRRILLSSPSWDARVAAGQALASIAAVIPPWTPRCAPQASQAHANSESPDPGAAAMLRLGEFDLERVLRHGAGLFGSAGEEYNVSNVDLAQQREQLKKDLGIDDRFAARKQSGSISQNGGDDVLGVQDEDLAVRTDLQPKAENQVAADEMVMEMQGISARERNRLKREARKRAKAASSTAPAKRPKKSLMQFKGESQTDADDSQTLSADKSQDAAGLNVDDGDDDLEALAGALGSSGSWALDATCEVLKQTLLHPRWEHRHGAAIGLREILKNHARSVGRSSTGYCEQATSDFCNAQWLEDVICRLLCVLALDRFGDFVGEGVVAPVRETAGMAIAAASKAMTPDRVHLLISTLETLFRAEFSNHWEVRHGGLHSLRYILAIREDLAQTVVPAVFPSLSQALSDDDDDVRAAAAAALQPIVPSLARLIPDKMTDLVHSLWESTLVLEDISASTGHVFSLLADLMDTPTADKYPTFWMSEESNLVELVPRLFPFLRHNSKTVRKSVLRVLTALITSEKTGTSFLWIQKILQELIGRIFRNVLLESDVDLLQTSKNLWQFLLQTVSASPSDLTSACFPKFATWLAAASRESRAKAAELDRDDPKRVQAPPKPGLPGKRRKKLVEHHAVAVEGPDEGYEMQQAAAWGLGHLLTVWPEGDNSAVHAFESGLCSEFATTRRVAADIFRYFLLCAKTPKPLLGSARESMLLELSGEGGCPIAEMGTVSSSMFNDTNALLEFFKSSKFQIPASLNQSSVRDICSAGVDALKTLNYSQSAVLQSELVPLSTKLVTEVFDSWSLDAAATKIPTGKREFVRALRLRILSAVGFFNHEKDALRSQLSAGCAAAIVSSAKDPLPKAVGPYIKALLGSVRTTRSPCYQGEMAKALAELAYRLSERDAKRPLSLMVRNIVKYSVDSYTLVNYSANAKSDDLKALEIEFGGTSRALQEFCSRFGAELPTRLPFLWAVFESLKISVSDIPRMNALLSLRLGSHCIHESLHSELFGLLPNVIAFCSVDSAEERQEAQKCLSDVVKVSPSKGMDVVVSKLVPMLGSGQPVAVRRGAVEALSGVVKNLGAVVVPYAAFLVVPTMKRMIDQAEEVRSAASEVFGALVRMMPLEEGAPDDLAMSTKLVTEREEAREFLGQLLGSRERKHYAMPVKIGDSVELRKYQQDCLDWLAFLNKYGLHGALCDDMGLGKTLMTLCMITASNHMLAESQSPTRPSLVACPSTLVGHWHQEAERFFGHALKNITMYAGPPKVRSQIRARQPFQNCDLVITSYEALSSDIDHFSQCDWDYLALDEGHVIKNSKTKVALAVRTVNSTHRLILTGTPIQNSVTELWSMFDFLMPGFLGTEKAFKTNYGKPITATRDPKASDKARDHGLAAMESLHRQVLPFILRRLKDDVLQELPPKIVQDYFCSMTPTQVRLYEDFSQSMLKNDFAPPHEDDEGDEEGNKTGSHVFQALQYLRRLCSHPALVLTPNHPEYDGITKELAASGRKITDLDQSAKLVSLRNILLECGIGVPQDGRNFTLAGGHRALIFAQTKAMLDLVEHDLLGKEMAEVTYLRMDGNVEASKRQPIVTRFNADPTIDCLLLTTHVGGLGLNLTGADTVIFLEHDWNPTKDLQAMDRAHRIGQKRTVNVYRLITRGTLEEKIMGIQKFKTHIANTVVNRDNSSLQSMNTGELLDLFKVEGETEDQARRPDQPTRVGDEDRQGKGLQKAIASVGELWDESQYAEEYDLGGFVRAIQK